MNQAAITTQLRMEVGPDGDEDVRYDALPSIWEEDDSKLLEKMLDFYPSSPPELILDATVNEGRFWRGINRPVIGLDLDSRYRPTVVGDSLVLPFQDAVFDVVVYDPPHVPNHGRERLKDFNVRFGVRVKSGRDTDYKLSFMFPDFATEAFRVLKPDGILLSKISDYIHNHRYQWAHIDLIHAAEAAGLMPCDCIIKVRKGPIIDPKWKAAYHARRRHCYWLVFRKSKKCE